MLSANEFQRLRDTFGEWSVRHVYDNDTLQYRFSDAKTQIVIGDQGMSLPFQINRNADGTFNFSFVYAWGRWEDINFFEGWITKVIIYVDSDKYEFTSDNEVLHTFEGEVDKKFLSAVAQANAIRIELFVRDNLQARGTISTKGSYAALRWLRAI
jgi:hypothetical protein